MEATRFSGADWASEIKEVLMVGLGGIGSWTAFSLSRIGHTLLLVDDDVVDETNVKGGQLYRPVDVGNYKVAAVHSLCRTMGCSNHMELLADKFNPTYHTGIPIVVTGLDNMKARKEVYQNWKKEVGYSTKKEDHLLIDGRLLIETMEVFAIQGNKPEQLEEYESEWLFDDSEVEEAECTTKQSSFAAMTIGGMITATLCNWLTNRKLGMDFREVPFHQRLYYPAFNYDIKEAKTKTEENGSSKEEKKIVEEVV